MIRVISYIRNKLLNVVYKAVVSRVTDSTGLQACTVRTATSSLEGVQRIQNYGTFGVPDGKNEAVVISFGGKRENSVVIVVDDSRSRPTGNAPGESGSYCKFGQKLHFKANGDAELSTNAGKITIKSNGDIDIGGAFTSKLMNLAAMSAFNSHTHIVTIPSLGTPTPTIAPTIPMVEALHCTTKVRAQ